MKKPSKEQGFSLAELLVVAVLGSLVVMSTYQVVITNQRVYAAQQVQIQGQQSARGGMDVLFGELREISPREGDIVDMDDTSIRVRVLRKFGHVCTAPDLATFRIRVRPIGPAFQVGESISFFVENDPSRMDDDAWVEGEVTANDASSACAASQPQQRLTIGSLSTVLVAGSVEEGAPVRAFTELEYGLFQRSGEWYLGRGVPGEGLDPLVGPLRAEDGVLFEPLNSAGQPATSTSFLDVAQIRVTLRTASEIRDSKGDLVRDSLVSTIYMRN